MQTSAVRDRKGLVLSQVIEYITEDEPTRPIYPIYVTYLVKLYKTCLTELSGVIPDRINYTQFQKRIIVQVLRYLVGHLNMVGYLADEECIVTMINWLILLVIGGP